MNNIEILENKIQCFRHLQNTLDDDEKELFEDGIQQKEIEAIENLIQDYKELKKYKKIAELTKISCCTAQNCEALNNAIKNGLENEKLIQENKELKEARDSLLWQRNFDMKILDEDYIPKLKLKEKFENMRKKHNNLFDIQTLYKEVLEEEWKYDSNNN